MVVVEITPMHCSQASHQNMYGQDGWQLVAGPAWFPMGEVGCQQGGEIQTAMCRLAVASTSA